MNEVGKLGQEMAHSWPQLLHIWEEKLIPPVGETVPCLGPPHITVLSKVPFSSALTNPDSRPACPSHPLPGMTYCCSSSTKDHRALCAQGQSPPLRQCLPARQAVRRAASSYVQVSKLEHNSKFSPTTVLVAFQPPWCTAAEMDSAGKNMSIVTQSSTR